MMRPIIALATLAATAAYVTAQNGVKQSSPMQGGRPTHDPTDEAVRQFEFVNQAQMADSPQPAAGLSDSQRPFRGGEVCILRDGGEECVNVNPKETVGGRSLADALTLDRRGRVWWDYARDIDDVVSSDSARMSLLWAMLNLLDVTTVECWGDDTARTHRFGGHETRPQTVSIDSDGPEYSV